MWRSLAWKEWREQRGVLASGFLLVAVLPLLLLGATVASGRTADSFGVLSFLPIVYPLLVWPLVTLAAGAIAFATDAGAGRWVHLLSKPVSRTTAWCAKAGMAVAVALLAIAFSETAVALLQRLLALTPPDLSGLGAGFDGRLAGLVSLGLPGLLVLCWATAIFWSLLLDKPVTVSLLAALSASLIFVAVSAARWRLDVLPAVNQWTLTEHSVLAALPFVVASWIGFRRGELLDGPSVRRAAGRTATALCVLVVILLGASTVWEMRPPGAEALLSEVAAASDGTILTTRARPDLLRSRSVEASTTTSGAETRITDRLADRPAISSNGRAVAWIAHGGPFGFLDSRSRLMVRWSPEDRPRIAVGGMPGFRDAEVSTPVFAPDGRAIAVEAERVLWIAFQDSRPPVTLQLERRCHFVGWSAVDDRPLLFCSSSGSGRDDATYYSVDPATGRPVDPIELPRGRRIAHLTPAFDPRDGYRLLPFKAYPRESTTRQESYVVDLVTRRFHRIGERLREPVADFFGDAVPTWFDIATAGDGIVWTAERSRPEWAVQVWARPRPAEEAMVVYQHTGVAVLDTSLSPGARWILLVVVHETEDSSELVAARTDGGAVRTLTDRGWLHGRAAWIDSHTVAVLDDPAWSIRSPELGVGPRPSLYRGWYRAIRVFDLDTGEEQLIRP